MRSLCALLLLLFMSAMARGEDTPGAEVPFQFHGAPEIAEFRRCQFNSFRGQDCGKLIGELCRRVESKNGQCRRYEVNQCHEANGFDQSETQCNEGPMFEYCYGNHAKCGTQEAASCRGNEYGDRYCKHYKWLDCEEKKFKTSDCKIFHNELMINYQEDKLADRMSWKYQGERRLRYQLPAMRKALDQVNEQIKAIEKQLDSIQQQLLDVLSTIIDELKKQKKELEKQLKELKKVREDLKTNIAEAEHTEAVCKKFTPFQKKAEP